MPFVMTTKATGTTATTGTTGTTRTTMTELQERGVLVVEIPASTAEIVLTLSKLQKR